MRLMKRLLMKIFGPRTKKTTAGAIAKMFDLELRGNAKTPITGIAPIADARPGDIAFYSTERNSEAFKILPISVLENTKASVIILQPENIKHAPKDAALIITERPRAEIVRVLGFLLLEKQRRGISIDAIVARGVTFRRKRSVYIAPFAVIERGVVIGENVQILSGAYIGRNCHIGNNTIVHPNAVIENATIGDDCVIHSGAAIGKDGFGYTRQDGKNVFIPHAGRVVLGNRVSVGANSTIDRGALTDTQIGDGTKLDNLVHVAHGVIIGKECFAASGVGISGGVVIGDRVLLGGNVGIANGLKIGDDVELGAKSGVMKNIPAGEKWLGYPALPAVEFLRQMVWLRNAYKKK